jgi:hypothetical protein
MLKPTRSRKESTGKTIGTALELITVMLKLKKKEFEDLK